MLITLLLTLTTLTSVLALPTTTPSSYGLHFEKRCGGQPCPPTEECTASVLYPEFPEGSTNLSIPDGARTVAVALAFGQQTYTCDSPSSTPIHTAHARLYDASPVLLSVPDPAVARYQLVSYAYVYQGLNPAYATYGLNETGSFIGKLSYVAVSDSTAEENNDDDDAPCTPATHDPSSSLLLPHYSLTRTTCPAPSSGAVTARQTASTRSPLSPPGANLDWSQMEVVEGAWKRDTAFAKWVFRTDTQGGAQPSASPPARPTTSSSGRFTGSSAEV